MTEEKTTASAKKSSKKAPEAEAEAAGAPAVFPYTLLDAPEEGTIEVDPKTLIVAPFDSRADSAAKLPPAFVEDIRVNGVLQAPLAVKVRDNATGKTHIMVCAGRRRVRAAIEAGIAKIKVDVRTMTLEDALFAAGSENIQRQALTFYDEAVYLRSLKDDYGMSGTSIAKRLGISNSKVSQTLMVFDLDPRVQKLIAKGELTGGVATKIRPLKDIEDGDVQHEIVLKGIADAWTAPDFKEAVDAYLAREAEKARRKAEKDEKKAAGKSDKKASASEDDEDDGEVSDKYDTKSITIVTKKESIAMLLNSIDRKLGKLNGVEEEARDEVKIAFEKGKLEGVKLVAGLKALPKSIAG